MIGYATFLGQVSIVSRPNLGQERDLAYKGAVIQGLAERLNLRKAEFDALPTDPATLNAMRPAFEKEYNRCAELIYKAKEEGALYPDQDFEVRRNNADACIDAMKVKLDQARRDLPEMVPASQRPTPTPGPSPMGVPTWAWVVGGLAAAGLIGYVATRK